MKTKKLKKFKGSAPPGKNGHGDDEEMKDEIKPIPSAVKKPTPLKVSSKKLVEEAPPKKVGRKPNPEKVKAPVNIFSTVKANPNEKVTPSGPFSVQKVTSAVKQ